MPKVYNKHHKNAPRGAVYIGRGSKWGNPCVIGEYGTREECIVGYLLYLLANVDLCVDIKEELRGKDLVCYCAPKPCHGDILLQLANNNEE
jgi:hypothetical protein